MEYLEPREASLKLTDEEKKILKKASETIIDIANVMQDCPYPRLEAEGYHRSPGLYELNEISEYLDFLVCNPILKIKNDRTKYNE